VNRVILLSDGLANVGPSSPDDFASLGAALLKEGISITTVGVGTDYNEDLMTRLARRSDGNTYFVESSGDLPRIFNEELGDVLNVVARKVVIEIQFPEGVRPLGLIGREGEIRNGKVVLNLNQLYGGQEKFALVEVAVAPMPAGARREVARARVSFDDELTQRHDSVASVLLVPFSSDRASVVKSANLKVQADYAANVIAMTGEKAVELVDAGKNQEAAEQLRSTSKRLKDLGTSYDNAKVSAMAAANKAEADRLETQGLDNIARKTYRTEDAQTISQQGAETDSREPSHQR
jgi:Ca-activated chloride channel family protein